MVRWIAGEAIYTSEGEHEREPVVLPRGAEGELPVPEVVGEEADLDKDEGEVNSMQELGLGIVEDEQQGQAHRQKAEGEGHLARVVSGLPVQQPVVLDQTLQLSVLISPWVGDETFYVGEETRSHPAIRLRVICLGA